MKNYYYNKYIDMYCIEGTSHCAEDLSDLEDVFGEMEEIAAPEWLDTCDDFDAVLEW